MYGPQIRICLFVKKLNKQQSVTYVTRLCSGNAWIRLACKRSRVQFPAPVSVLCLIVLFCMYIVLINSSEKNAKPLGKHSLINFLMLKSDFCRMRFPKLFPNTPFVILRDGRSSISVVQVLQYLLQTIFSIVFVNTL